MLANEFVERMSLYLQEYLKYDESKAKRYASKYYHVLRSIGVNPHIIKEIKWNEEKEVMVDTRNMVYKKLTVLEKKRRQNAN